MDLSHPTQASVTKSNTILLDYYDNSIGSTYADEYQNETGVLLYNKQEITETAFYFSPNDIGTKTTFVVKPEIDLLDIFGLAGGMYSSIEQVLTYFSVIIIWGCSFACCKFGGVANEAGPDGLIRQQLEGFLKARDETIVELTQRIVDLEEMIGVDSNKYDGRRISVINTPKLKAAAARANSNNNTNNNNSKTKRTDTIYKQTTTPKQKAQSSPDQRPSMTAMQLDDVPEN